MIDEVVVMVENGGCGWWIVRLIMEGDDNGGDL